MTKPTAMGANRKCAMNHVSPCANKLSREHFISKSVLDRVFEGSSGIVHCWWLGSQPKQLTANALTARILCQKHNNELSPLDMAGVRFFEGLQKALAPPIAGEPLQSHISLCGLEVERWLLKVVFGLWAADLAASPPHRLERFPPLQPRTMGAL